METLRLNGRSLDLEGFGRVVLQQGGVALDSDAKEQVTLSRRIVEEILSSNKVAYAITTGVGKLSEVKIAPEQNQQLQLNLLRSHAVGVGEPLTQHESRGMMLLRANSLAKGNSGVRPVIIETLCEMLNLGVHPVIPSQGSVGASGDLAPLAHLALVLIGEGEAWFKGRRMSGAEAMRDAGIPTITLEAKEAISLINGTQAMLSCGALALIRALNLVDTADALGAASLEALKGTVVAMDQRIHQARPHPGQIQSAANIRAMLEGESSVRESHRDCGKVQDAYSLRCIPQVHGAVRDTLDFARRTFETEMNSAVDNPLVFAPPAGMHESGAEPATETAAGDVISGGNFHGEPVAFVLDYLAVALSALAGISERRFARLVNPQWSECFPAWLAAGAGLNSGFMMAQVTAAALVSENKVFAHPASVDSITTSGNKEDYVSMGMTGAIKLKKIIENVTNVLVIEAMCAAQGLDFLRPLKSTARVERVYEAIRKVSAFVDQDRVLTSDFAAISEVIQSGAIASALR
ncbi:MAG: histidine ammonia-lyase [Acidobacteriaceae bacterium]